MAQIMINKYFGVKKLVMNFRINRCIIAFIIFSSCSTSRTSMLITESYDQKLDVTTQTQIPYGSIEIPGKWRKTKYLSTSRQHFFINQDSISIAVAKQLKEDYPFYLEDTSSNFAQNFYEWEKNYYEKQGFTISKLEENSTLNYVIWEAKGNSTNTIFLYGGKGKLAYNFAVFSGHWSKVETVDFLKCMFERN